ncbi:hypothetical protein QTN25_006483 [Entamoeba marina]
MTDRIKQPKYKIDETSAEVKQKSLASIHRRIISISWILVKRFGYTIEINREKRKSKLTFPYYLVSRITSYENAILFDSNELSKEFQNRTNCREKKQIETNWIKKMLNNKLIETLESLGFRVKTKSNKQSTKCGWMTMDNRTTLKLDYICYENKKYDMKLVEKIIGDEANESLKKFFNDNQDVKCATFYLNDGKVMSRFERDNQVIVLPTEINPIDQLSDIQSTPSSENLSCSTEQSQQASYVSNTTEVVGPENNGIESVNQININELNELSGLNQMNCRNEMNQQPNEEFPFYYCNNGVVYYLTPIDKDSKMPNGLYYCDNDIMYSLAPIGYNPNMPNGLIPKANEYGQQTINYFENCFNDGLLQPHIC